MPAKSKAQQRAAGAALSAKRGDTPKSKMQRRIETDGELDERKGAAQDGLDQAPRQTRARSRELKP